VLEREVLSVISPLLIELEELGEPLTFDEFYDSMENLIAKLTPSDKRTLLKPRKPSAHPTPEQSQTLTASHTQHSTSTISRSISGPSLYTRNMKHVKETQDRLRKK
jgi:hypothetical protein